MDAAGWNERYLARTVWSGEPNAALVAVVSDLDNPAAGSRDVAARTALDVGCGEGADALWLAGHGWDVTGVDWSDVALERAASGISAAGLDARFAQGDATDAGFLAGLAATGTFDLILLGYIHPEPDERDRAYAHLAALMSPGGYLLVITHDPQHGLLGFDGPPPERLLSPADILAALRLPNGYEVALSEVRARERDGQVTAMDSVVLVHRLA
ncbi:MAG: class I SAM-dependent methyltransferase [Actinomycetota bacterium]|nr:class I SAM-dependent methyltransferase [Actinomycetota bacterium]